MLARLAPPKWPEEVFGKIDREKAAAGKALFVEHLRGLPQRVALHVDRAEQVRQALRPGRAGAAIIRRHRSSSSRSAALRDHGSVERLLPPPFKGKTLCPTGDIYTVSRKQSWQRRLRKLNLTEARDSSICMGYREFPLPRPPLTVYKAAPRDGVWATPPFMHNGSVPNLYEMLVPGQGAHEEILRGSANSIR